MDDAGNILLLALVFFAVAGIAIAAGTAFVPAVADRRLRQVVGDAGDPEAASPLRDTIVAALSPAGRLSLPAEGWEKSPLRQRFIRAGLRNDDAVMLFFGAKTLLAAVLPLVYLFFAEVLRGSLSLNEGLLAGLALAALGYYLPNLYLRHRLARRQREMFEALPDAIDLMTMMVEAGLGLDAALGRVAQEMGPQSPVVEEEFQLVTLELRAGASREQALRNLAARSGIDELEMFVAMLIQADRFGTSMADALRVHSNELRTKRKLRAEEAATKMAMKLLFPLVLCIFPSILIVLHGPAVISIYRIFSPLAAH
jgi:tight adherence protein C